MKYFSCEYYIFLSIHSISLDFHIPVGIIQFSLHTCFRLGCLFRLPLLMMLRLYFHVLFASYLIPVPLPLSSLIGSSSFLRYFRGSSAWCCHLYLPVVGSYTTQTLFLTGFLRKSVRPFIERNFNMVAVLVFKTSHAFAKIHSPILRVISFLLLLIRLIFYSPFLIRFYYSHLFLCPSSARELRHLIKEYFFGPLLFFDECVQLTDSCLATVVAQHSWVPLANRIRTQNAFPTTGRSSHWLGKTEYVPYSGCDWLCITPWRPFMKRVRKFVRKMWIHHLTLNN